MMKSFSIAFCFSLTSLVNGFTTVKPVRSSLRLKYERDETHESLTEEWQKLHGPRIRRELELQLEGQDMPNQVGDSLALVLPKSTLSISWKEEPSNAETTRANSYQGLTNPSKAGLVLSVALMVGMVATNQYLHLSSATFDLSQLSFLTDAIHDTLLKGMDLTNHLDQILAYWMQLAMAKYLMLVDDLQLASEGARQALTEYSAIMMQHAQSISDVLSERLHELQTTWTQDVQGWNQALVTQVEASKDSTLELLQDLQNNGNVISNRLSETQSAWILTVEDCYQDVLAQIDTSKESLTTAFQGAQADFTTTLIDGKESARTSLGTMQSNIGKIQTDWIQEVQDNVQASKESSANMMQQVQVTLDNRLSDLSWKNGFQSVYQEFMEGASTILVKAKLFKDGLPT
jgi:hypothetical protein